MFNVVWGIERCFCFQVLFIKDVIGSAEICCWSFYGHGKKITEVRERGKARLFSKESSVPLPKKCLDKEEKSLAQMKLRLSKHLNRIAFLDARASKHPAAFFFSNRSNCFSLYVWKAISQTSLHFCCKRRSAAPRSCTPRTARTPRWSSPRPGSTRRPSTACSTRTGTGRTRS